MAISQGKVLENMEKLVKKISPDTFIFDFLGAHGFPKATITKIKNGDMTRNVGLNGDVGIKKHVLFRSVSGGSNLETELEKLASDDVVSKHQIRFVIATDYQTIVAKDLAAKEELKAAIDELDKDYTFFLPLAGYEKAIIHSEHPADVRASEKMGRLFDLIKERNDLSKPEDIHALNVFLTRLLFCFYAEDTGIFQEQQVTGLIKSITSSDGSDVDQFFTDLFTILNLPDDSAERKKMPNHFQAFPFVNGGLFREDEPIPEFGQKARRMLIECGDLSWSEINPDIFGSMFQAVIDEEQRGNLGQHYTSVSNIMKVIQPLFLDGLWSDLEKSKSSERKLKELLVRLQNIRVFDPACGSGNFLIIAYKELRRFEMAVIDSLNEISAQSEIYYSGIKLSQFFGIEIDDFAHEVAILSLWLTEHQMNTAFRLKFGIAQPSLPLRDAGKIVQGNALEISWASVCDPDAFEGEIFVCGNPPFIGDRFRSKKQSDELKQALFPVKNVGKVDYVAGWFFKAFHFMKLSPEKIETSFVSTNSIFQGVQASLIWGFLLENGLIINFAHKVFKWTNNAKRNAGVHVAISGFSLSQRSEKFLFENGFAKKVSNISPYLVEGSNFVVQKRSSTLCPSKKMLMGNYTNDGGFLIFGEAEKDLILDQDSRSRTWLREIVGADEFLNGKRRFCFWLADASAEEISEIPIIAERVENVRKKRLASSDVGSQRQAKTPHLFREQYAPKSFIFIPQVSSERRKYIPIDLIPGDKIPIAPNFFVEDGDLFDFAILTSMAHNDWMRAVAGRMKSDYRYSPTLVYNTFPWPNSTDPQKNKIKDLAEVILLVREDFPDKTLSDLYDPDRMPRELAIAHSELDDAVDRLYREKPFADSSERLEHLFKVFSRLANS